ncbi:hypothetical protein [Echinicola shivajiensis]|uniref:hypothetical protein n=1 Tax=Echinicola shivajiensis TaxID=1035916 RepID=UPI001BFC4E31|nr:hypothetical protein [Echinicola shivajiensis]
MIFLVFLYFLGCALLLAALIITFLKIQKIKKSVYKSEDYWCMQYQKHQFFQEEELARESLKEALWAFLSAKDLKKLNSDLKMQRYRAGKVKYEHLFKENGLEYPEPGYFQTMAS